MSQCPLFRAQDDLETRAPDEPVTRMAGARGGDEGRRVVAGRFPRRICVKAATTVTDADTKTQTPLSISYSHCCYFTETHFVGNQFLPVVTGPDTWRHIFCLRSHVVRALQLLVLTVIIRPINMWRTQLFVLIYYFTITSILL